MDSGESSINHHTSRPRCAIAIGRALSSLWVDSIDIVDESVASAPYGQLRGLFQDEILSRLLSLTSQEHLETMAIDKPRLARWEELTFDNHVIARQYGPSGSTLLMDVFYSHTPDAFHAKTAKNMMDKHLYKWQQFRETNVAFHQAPGTHNDTLTRKQCFLIIQSSKECCATARYLRLPPLFRRLLICL